MLVKWSIYIIREFIGKKITAHIWKFSNSKLSGIIIIVR